MEKHIRTDDAVDDTDVREVTCASEVKQYTIHYEQPIQ